nr:MraY family glycosyltransferase [Ardenticatena sp.]
MPTGNLLLIFGTALLLAFTGTPVMQRVAVRLGMVDRPSARKLHATPIPLLGGIAIYAGVLLSLLAWGERRFIVETAAVLVGATWIVLWGAWDDRSNLHAYAKMAAQLAAAMMLIMAGIQVQLPFLPAWGDVAITLLWIVGITNAFNLLDNMDGLASGVAAVAAAYFLLLAALSGQYLVGAMAAATLGACIGFLRHNFRLSSASIFMGDAGSLFLGFVLAVLGIKLRFPTNVPWVTWMVPPLVLIVPIFDTTLVFISRLRRGKNPLTTPGKDHLSHRLVRMGWTRREAVLLLYLLGCAGGGLSIYVSVSSRTTAYVLAGILALLTIGAILWLERRESMTT